MSVSTDRYKRRPWGVFGGEPGGNSACHIQHRNGEVEKLAWSKVTRPIDEGDVVSLTTPGAGGWGDPITRDGEKVAWDVKEGFITVERARESYGVVLKKLDHGNYEVDQEETRALREKLKASRAPERQGVVTS